MTFGQAHLKQEKSRIRFDSRTSRSDLHIDKLGDFTLWLMANGWQYHPTRGEYEVLRMSHADYALPLIVHRREAVGGIERQHLTTQGTSDFMFRKWRKSINGEREKGRADLAAAVVEASKRL